MFSGFEDRLDLFPVAPNPTWPLAAILEISNVRMTISGKGRPINFGFGSRVYRFHGRWIDWRYFPFDLWYSSRDLQTSAILESSKSSNDDISATGGPIDFVFDSRVGFSIGVGGSNGAISGSIKLKMAAMTWHDVIEDIDKSQAKSRWPLFLPRSSEDKRSRPSVLVYGADFFVDRTN